MESGEWLGPWRHFIHERTNGRRSKLGSSRAESIPKIWDSEAIRNSKESILFPILWPKTVTLNQFSILGNQNRLSPREEGVGTWPLTAAGNPRCTQLCQSFFLPASVASASKLRLYVEEELVPTRYGTQAVSFIIDSIKLGLDTLPWWSRGSQNIR